MTKAPRPLPAASVVVPTFNRLSDLQLVIGALCEQVAELPSPCQIVVVDDGSTDGTGAWLDSHAAGLGVVVLHQDNSGPARARNRGVEASDGSVVLFLGDDTVPQPGWLHEHLEAHRIGGSDRAVAILGYTSFPAGKTTPFLRWINEYGAQFGYALIDEPTEVPFNFFYTSNISLPRRVFNDLGGFREDFPAAAWEDIEFAYRAIEDGLSIRYNPRARTIHNHRMRVGTFAERQQKSGRSGAIFAGLHPELEGFLGVPCVTRMSGRTRIERSFLRAWIAMGEFLPGSTGDRTYRRFFDGYYLEGLAEGLRDATIQKGFAKR